MPKAAVESVLTAAVAKGLAQMDREKIEAQMLKLFHQVGELESEVAFAFKAIQDFQAEITVLADRNASLEDGLKAVSRKCYWRVMGYCDLACPGRAFCDVSGLRGFDFSELRLSTGNGEPLLGTRPS